MKIKKTGVIELLDELNNKSVWMYIVNGIFSQKEGKAWFELDNGQKGKTSLVIHQVIPKGKVPIKMLYEPGMKSILYPDLERENQILAEGFSQIFQSMVQDSWLLIGVIFISNKEIPVAILYFESFRQASYSLLNLEQKQAIGEYVKYLN